MTKILFINDSASQRNWGDRAAAISLRTMMGGLGGEIVAVITERELHRSAFLEGPPLPETPPPMSAKDVLRPFIPPVILQARNRLVAERADSRKESVIPDAWGRFEKSAKVVLGRANPWPALPAAIEGCDLAVIHGNGAMVGNGVHPRALLFLAYLAKKHFGKPVVMVNHTADFEHPALLEMARNVYPLFDDVVFRDTISVERWADLGGGRYAPDTAFHFAPYRRDEWVPLAKRLSFFDVWPDTGAFDPSRPYLCLGGSSVYAQHAGVNTVVGSWIHLIERLRRAYPHQIVLTASDVVDAEVFRSVAARLGLPLIGLHTSVQQSVDVLGNADAYIGGRWHAGIFALRGGAPLISLTAKTFKMRALGEMAGLPASSFDAFDLEAGGVAIVNHLLALLEQGDALRAKLRLWAEGMSVGCWDNLRYLKDLG